MHITLSDRAATRRERTHLDAPKALDIKALGIEGLSCVASGHS
jgi:hypothetical protein